MPRCDTRRTSAICSRGESDAKPAAARDPMTDTTAPTIGAIGERLDLQIRQVATQPREH